MEHDEGIGGEATSDILWLPKILHPYSRTPGDIDIWVEGGDKRVFSFVCSISPYEKACYHHIEFPPYKGVEVEVHCSPILISETL
ncbi:hypothetical protein F7D95_09390 [Prevotella copri]|uniref:Uncharacterized protein n=1 Tax=Segatella copri TaxID=165179 RepID=A0AA90UFR9_9BACT|nr:hypothetical protein [Segatella copri]MQN13028.1 hypothetical protein [Segatella copri]